MVAYYLAAYGGSGTDDDLFRPAGVDGVEAWHSIDFRPPGRDDGWALVCIPDGDGGGARPGDVDSPNGGPERVYLGADLDALTAKARHAVESRLGVDLSAAKTLRHVVADLLIRHGNDARKDRWNQLKPDGDGWHRIHLGGLVHESPRMAALSLADSMVRGNNADINALAPVTWGQGNANFGINSNIAKNSAVVFDACRAESDLATADQFSQCTLFLITSTTGSAGAAVRFNSANYERYEVRVQQNGQSYQIIKRTTTNTGTALVSKTAATLTPSSKVMRLEVTGSSLTSILDAAGVNDIQTVTDTTITGNLRVGWCAGLGGGGTNRQGISGWTAGDLGSSTVTATLAAALGAVSTAAAAVPKINATLAAPLGALTSPAAATVTEPAALAASLGGLSTAAAAIPTHPATLSAPLGALTSPAAAVPKVVASLAAPLGGLTTAATAKVTEPATLAATLGALTVTAGGVASEPATLAAVLGALTVTAGGVASEPSVLAVLLGALTFSSAATVTHPAALAAPLGALTATGTAVPSAPPALAAPLGPLTSAAAGGVTEPATLSAPLGPLTVTATAKVTEPAALAAPLGALDMQATAVAVVNAALAAALGALTMTAQGTETHPAALHAPLGGLRLTAQGLLVKTAVLAAVLGALTTRIHGPIPTFEPIVRFYANDNRARYRVDNRRAYATDNRRDYR